MSVFQPIAGFLEEPKFTLLSTGNATDVLTMAAGDTRAYTVIGVTISNADSAARVCSVWVTQDTTDYLIWTKSVAADTTEECISNPVRLYAKSTARKIRVQAASATTNTVTVAVTYAVATQSGSGANAG